MSDLTLQQDCTSLKAANPEALTGTFVINVPGYGLKSAR